MLLLDLFSSPTTCWIKFLSHNYMGSVYEGEQNYGGFRENQRKLKPSSVIFLFFLSVLVSVAGGSVFVWWLHKYRSENRELWMVPFGLIFCLTPIFIWFSLIVSELCASHREEEEEDDDDDGVVLRKNRRLVHPTDDSVLDQKIIWSEKVSFSS